MSASSLSPSSPLADLPCRLSQTSGQPLAELSPSWGGGNFKEASRDANLFSCPKISPTNYNLCLQGKIKPLHSYSRWKRCLEYGITVRTPRFCLCPFCSVSLDCTFPDTIMKFWKFLWPTGPTFWTKPNLCRLIHPHDRARKLEERFLD